jgi:hypothetical protein
VATREKNRLNQWKVGREENENLIRTQTTRVVEVNMIQNLSLAQTIALALGNEETNNSINNF